MITETNWIYSMRDNTDTLTHPFKVNIQGMINSFNSKAVLTYEYGLPRLLRFVTAAWKEASNVGEFFTDYNTWLSSLTYYPFDINYWKELVGLTDGVTIVRDSQGLQIGKNKVGDTNADFIIWCEDVSARCTMFNLGELHIPKHFENFADYNGYTKIQIFLPYYGFVDVNPNDVIDKYLQIRLQVDLNTGIAQYYVGVSERTITNDYAPLQFKVNDVDTRILSTHSFQLGVNIPLGTSNASEIARNIALGSVKGALTLAGYAIGGAAGTGVSTVTTSIAPKVVTKTKRSGKKNGRQVIANRWTTEYGDTVRTYDHTNSYRQQAINEVFSTSAQALSNLNFTVQTDRPNNSLANSFGPLSVKVVIYRPKIVNSNDDFLKLYGEPLGEVRELSTVDGYTEISKIFFEGDDFDEATQYEIALLEQAFSEGIIL